MSKKAIEILNTIMERELAGVVRYIHYALTVFDHTRIPILSWLRARAGEFLKLKKCCANQNKEWIWIGH